MADERTEKQKVLEITEKLEQGLKELFESEKYKSYLSTMSKFHNYSFNNTLLIAMQKPDATLVAGYKAWQKNFERHVNKGEKAIRMQDITLLVRNNDLTEYDLLNVRGLDEESLSSALLAMNEDDRLSVEAYLESRGAWVTPLADEETREVREYHLDYVYNTDTQEITNVKELQQMQEQSLEPINASDVIVRVSGSMGNDYEIDKITNMTAEQVKGILYDMAILDENEWDGNVQEYLKESGAEFIPIMASNGLNEEYPQFYDFEYNADSEEIIAATELPVMKQAENLINRLEFGETLFSDDERNLIVNYAYKLDDMDKTRELAEKLAYQIGYEPNVVNLRK